MRPNLVLASTSSYRAALLKQLKLPFEILDPNTAETFIQGESPKHRAIRLARDKAIAGAASLSNRKDSIVIGSDQVAHLGNTVFSKPGSYDKAFTQLRASAGHWITFSVAICLCNQDGDVLTEGLDEFSIEFRELSDAQIATYLKADTPYDCAGSIKAESLGVALFRQTRGKDINTLYGLPLILLTDLLARIGIEVL